MKKKSISKKVQYRDKQKKSSGLQPRIEQSLEDRS